MSEVLAPEEAMLELTIWDAEAKSNSFTETIVELLNKGVPAEVVTRLEELWTATKVFADEVIHIGKIVVAKIVEFVKENANLAVGIALGAAVGALAGGVPLIGSLLEPLAMTVGGLYGAFVGMQMDLNRRPNPLVEAAVVLARKFFELFASVVNAVWKAYGEK